jgi:hypothetical protein
MVDGAPHIHTQWQFPQPLIIIIIIYNLTKVENRFYLIQRCEFLIALRIKNLITNSY